MKKFIGDLSALAPVWEFNHEAEASDEEDFEYIAKEYMSDMYPEASDIEVRNIKEIS